MSVKDYVGKTISLKQSSTFDIKELYKNLKTWLTDRGYTVAEPSYSEKPLADGLKHTSFFWMATKKVEDYTKLAIEISFEAETKEVTLEKDKKMHNLQEGDAEFSFAAYISKDVEDDWAIRETSGVQRFLRELYDKLFNKGKYDDYEDKLKKDVESIVHDVKTYLRMHRFD